MPVSGCADGRAFCLGAYNMEDNRDVYKVLTELKNSGWAPGRKGFVHIYDHGGTWSVSRLSETMTKVVVHRYKPDEILVFDILQSVEQFAHKKLTYKDFAEGSYDPLVRIK